MWFQSLFRLNALHGRRSCSHRSCAAPQAQSQEAFSRGRSRSQAAIQAGMQGQRHCSPVLSANGCRRSTLFLTLWRTRSQVIADQQNQQPAAQSADCLFSCFKQGPSYAASAAIASITASKVTWPFFTFSPLARCGSRSSAARP